MRIFNSYVGLLDGNHPKQPGFMNAILPEISHPRTWLVTHDVSMSISEWMVGLLEVWVWQIHTNPISETQCNWVWNIWNVSPTFPESPPSPSSPSSRSFLTIAGGKPDIIEFHWAGAKSYMARHEGSRSGQLLLKTLIFFLRALLQSRLKIAVNTSASEQFFFFF